MYIKIFRCKMCGKEIQKEKVNRLVAELDYLKETKKERHFCNNGDLGIAEFIGYRKLTDS